MCYINNYRVNLDTRCITSNYWPNVQCLPFEQAVMMLELCTCLNVSGRDSPDTDGNVYTKPQLITETFNTNLMVQVRLQTGLTAIRFFTTTIKTTLSEP
jgi:hypothetical protein